MKYGQIYSQLSYPVFKKTFEKPFLELFLLGGYFHFFGFPSLGGHLQLLYVISFLKPQKGEKILDAGCGNGIYCLEISDKYKSSCVGVDVDKSRIKLAKLQADSLKLSSEFELMSLTDLKFPDNLFDKVFSVQTLQFIKDDKKAVREIGRVLKKGGLLILSFPGEKYYRYTKERPKKRNLKTMIVKRSGYSLQTMQKLLPSSGFKILKKRIITGPLFKKVTNVQNYLYMKNLNLLNFLFFPFLLFLAKIDAILRKADPQEAVYILKAVKK